MQVQVHVGRRGAQTHTSFVMEPVEGAGVVSRQPRTRTLAVAHRALTVTVGAVLDEEVIHAAVDLDLSTTHALGVLVRITRRLAL